MSATDDVARMLTMVPWLLAQEAPTIAQTMAAFDITEEQVHEDVERLNFCGLPGFRGGDLFECDLVGDTILLRMADELRRPLRLGSAEAVRLVLLLETAVNVLDEDVPALRSGLAKVRLAAGVPDSVTVEVLDGDNTWTAPLRAAIGDGRQVSFTYLGRADDTPRTRTVDPWAVHVEDGRLYLQGHDLDAEGSRSFRLDRLADLVVSDAPIVTTAPDSLRSPAYEAAPDDLAITLILEPWARWVAEALDTETVKERKDGGARVTLRTDAPAHVDRLVLQAGGGARIHQPKSSRVALTDRVAVALERYSATDLA